MKSSYFCLIACVAALNFSVYSTDKLTSQNVYESFAKQTATTLAATTKSGYQDEFSKAAAKVKSKLSDKSLSDFKGKNETEVVEYLISPFGRPEWRLTSEVKESPANQSLILKTAGIDRKDLDKIAKSYYENVTKTLFDKFQFVNSVPDKAFKKLDSLDYGKAMTRIEKGILGNTTQLWSIYENYKDSDSYFKKIVGSVSAFLAAVCASNDDTLALNKIKNGEDVYKCLLNLGYENLKNPSEADKKAMTFDKLMTSLPDFMASLKTQKLLDKVTKGRNSGKDDKKSKQSEKGSQGDQKTPVTKVNMKKWGKK